MYAYMNKIKRGRLLCLRNAPMETAATPVLLSRKIKVTRVETREPATLIERRTLSSRTVFLTSVQSAKVSRKHFWQKIPFA